MEIPADFGAFRFADIRSVVMQRNRVFSDVLRFHKNTEFKARAALCHVQRFETAYADYLEKQPGPDDQSVFNLDHPLKEIVFFEYLAAVASLIGCFDSAVQEVNCLFDLGLAATREKGKEEVSLGAVIRRLRDVAPQSQVLMTLVALTDDNNEATHWFRFLRRLRNTGLHADLYASSFESRNIARILSVLEEEDRNGRIRSKEDLQRHIKRDVIVRLDGGEYPMSGLLQELTRKTLACVDDIHRRFHC